MSALSLTVAAWLQIYYELKAEREKQGLEKQIALIRVEQLAPFPFDLVCRELRRYPNAEIMWCAVPHHPADSSTFSAGSALRRRQSS